MGCDAKFRKPMILVRMFLLVTSASECRLHRDAVTTNDWLSQRQLSQNQRISGKRRWSSRILQVGFVPKWWTFLKKRNNVNSEDEKWLGLGYPHSSGPRWGWLISHLSTSDIIEVWICVGWLVVWLPSILFSHIYIYILGISNHPLIDEVIFFRGVAQPPTSLGGCFFAWRPILPMEDENHNSGLKALNYEGRSPEKTVVMCSTESAAISRGLTVKSHVFGNHPMWFTWIRCMACQNHWKLSQEAKSTARPVKSDFCPEIDSNQLSPVVHFEGGVFFADFGDFDPWVCLLVFALSTMKHAPKLGFDQSTVFLGFDPHWRKMFAYCHAFSVWASHFLEKHRNHTRIFR